MDESKKQEISAIKEEYSRLCRTIDATMNKHEHWCDAVIATLSGRRYNKVGTYMNDAIFAFGRLHLLELDGTVPNELEGALRDMRKWSQRMSWFIRVMATLHETPKTADVLQWAVECHYLTPGPNGLPDPANRGYAVRLHAYASACIQCHPELRRYIWADLDGPAKKPASASLLDQSEDDDLAEEGNQRAAKRPRTGTRLSDLLNEGNTAARTGFDEDMS